LVPNLELAALIGCRIEDGFVATDDMLQTSVAGVFCAGEPTSIGGVELALLEGKIAGLAAAVGTAAAEKLVSHRRRRLRFVHALRSATALDPQLRKLATETTLVCRCEDVSYGALRKHVSWRDAKLQTRCGMGPCQGRICGAATEFLFGWDSARRERARHRRHHDPVRQVQPFQLERPEKNVAGHPCSMVQLAVLRA